MAKSLVEEAEKHQAQAKEAEQFLTKTVGRLFSGKPVQPPPKRKLPLILSITEEYRDALRAGEPKRLAVASGQFFGMGAPLLQSGMSDATDYIGQVTLGEKKDWFNDRGPEDTGKKVQGYVANVVTSANPVGGAIGTGTLAGNLIADPEKTWAEVKKSYTDAFNEKAPMVDRIFSGINWATTILGLGAGGVKGGNAIMRSRVLRTLKDEGWTPYQAEHMVRTAEARNGRVARSPAEVGDTISRVKNARAMRRDRSPHDDPEGYYTQRVGVPETSAAPKKAGPIQTAVRRAITTHRRNSLTKILDYYDIPRERQALLLDLFEEALNEPNTGGRAQTMLPSYDPKPHHRPKELGEAYVSNPGETIYEHGQAVGGTYKGKKDAVAGIRENKAALLKGDEVAFKAIVNYFDSIHPGSLEDVFYRFPEGVSRSSDGTGVIRSIYTNDFDKALGQKKGPMVRTGKSATYQDAQVFFADLVHETAHSLEDILTTAETKALKREYRLLKIFSGREFKKSYSMHDRSELFAHKAADYEYMKHFLTELAESGDSRLQSQALKAIYKQIGTEARRRKFLSLMLGNNNFKKLYKAVTEGGQEGRPRRADVKYRE